MILEPGVLCQRVQLWAENATTMGIAVTGTTAHTKGSWTSLIDPTAFPVYGIWISPCNLSVNATITGGLLDIGYGPTGGGNEQVVIPNINVGAAQAATSPQPAKVMFFPCFMPAGVRISARVQTAILDDTLDLYFLLEQSPLYGHVVGAWQDYGTDSANTRGVTMDPGTDAFNTWTQITSSTARRHRFWIVEMDQGTDTATGSTPDLIEVGIGPDSSNVTKLFEASIYQDATEGVAGAHPLIHEAAVPAGAALWAHIASESNTGSRALILYGM